MDRTRMSRLLDEGSVKLTDAFFQRVMELVRTEVIPYQWETLNDRIADAAPSYCMHNFRAAGQRLAMKKRMGDAFEDRKYVPGSIETLPDDPANPLEDEFYGFVFQDSDFYKWIEAVGYSLGGHPDSALEAIADEAIDVVCAAQMEDGYLDTYYILGGMDGALKNLRDHHELYCLGHLIEGAIAYYRGTGKDKLLRAACRYADYMDAHLGAQEGKLRGYPGHEIAEMALIRLYEITDEARYLALAQYFIDERGRQPNYFIEEEKARAAREGKKLIRYTTNPAYHQAHKPVREQEEAVGHAVRAVYLYSGMADAARLTGDETLYAACRRLWESIVTKKLYITGGIGGTHIGESFSYAYDLPGDSAYSETCAAIGLMFFARRMLQISPESQYADVMEMALYNTVLAGMALDGKSFFYVNPLTVVPESCRRDERLAHVKPVRQKWFGCACCPPNIARIVSSIAQYTCTQGDGVLYTHLYMSGETRMKLEDGELALLTQAGMPWSGDVKIRIRASKPVQATLAFRIPGWTENETLCAPGKAQQLRDGYVYFSGTWRDGDEISLTFPMPVRMVAADPRVRETFGQAAFVRGPVTFCAEEADNGGNLHLLRADRDKIGANGEGIAVCMDDAFGHPTAALLVPGWRTLLPQAGALYAKAGAMPEGETVIRMIPYYAWANRGEGEMRVWLRS